MNKIERFEDIIAWQRARALTREIYTCTRVGPFARDFGLERSDSAGFGFHNVEHCRRL